jgi:hypothetical protein
MAEAFAFSGTLTVTASGAITANRLVGFDGAQATVAGQKILGVAATKAAIGETLTVQVGHTAMVEAGDEIAVGASLTVDSQGRAVPAEALAIAAGATAVTSAAANGATALSGGDPPVFVFADALEAATAAGKLIAIKFR